MSIWRIVWNILNILYRDLAIVTWTRISWKLFFYGPLREDSLDMLNIVGKGNISKEDFDSIWDLCIQCSRGVSRNKHKIWTSKTSSGGITKVEIGNLLDNLKTDILSTLSSEMDTFQEKQNKMELERNMAIFFPQCRKKHPLNTVETCAICQHNYPTSSCPSLPRLKVVFQGKKWRSRTTMIYGL